MELRQLEYFRAIVDAGTISGAARVLHMTQPPLSYQIKMLEEELQVPLLIRGTKKITLTEAGKTLYEQAGTLLMLADLTRREVVKSSQSATLHIGMTPSTVSLLADYLLRFSRKYPHIHFDVHEFYLCFKRPARKSHGGSHHAPHANRFKWLRDEDPFKREHHRHGTPFSPAFCRA
ncbi:LysR family transcriptional regulator [Blautia sp. AM47-4]|uniref:LysR family transcriptional regulator n=1 Tax=Blautia sp. AM47-4 TaxID=2292979 RepID=UPI001FAA8661|nr:LysR family transcriptional regulator [Blautia sp. AM47-4]